MAVWIFVAIAAVALAAFVFAVGKFAPREETYHGFYATGISPVGALDHVEAAIRPLDGYETARTDNTVTIARGPGIEALEDVLRVTATRAEVGTIVEIAGSAESRIIAAVRDALARTPPWTRSL